MSALSGDVQLPCWQLIVSLCGIDVTGWGTVFGYIFKSSINSGVVAMVGGLIIVPVISLITKKQSKEEIDQYVPVLRGNGRSAGERIVGRLGIKLSVTE